MLISLDNWGFVTFISQFQKWVEIECIFLALIYNLPKPVQ